MCHPFTQIAVEAAACKSQCMNVYNPRTVLGNTSSWVVVQSSPGSLSSVGSFKVMGNDCRINWIVFYSSRKAKLVSLRPGRDSSETLLHKLTNLTLKLHVNRTINIVSPLSSLCLWSIFVPLYVTSYHQLVMFTLWQLHMKPVATRSLVPRLHPPGEEGSGYNTTYRLIQWRSPSGMWNDQSQRS